jgi:hypothetical protein
MRRESFVCAPDDQMHVQELTREVSLMTSYLHNASEVPSFMSAFGTMKVSSRLHTDGRQSSLADENMYATSSFHMDRTTEHDWVFEVLDRRK